MRKSVVVASVIFGINSFAPDSGAGIDSLYGDGAAGSRVITADETLADPILNYKSFTIEPGVTLTVPTGTVIRCTGKFVNHGTIVVQTGPSSRAFSSTPNGFTIEIPSVTPPTTGIALGPAGSGEWGTKIVARAGGDGGIGVGGIAQGREASRPGASGGGAGGANIRSNGGGGGGSLAILAKSGVTNAVDGTIRAQGENGGPGAGGGAGGVLVLASEKKVTNDGIIEVIGGNGGSFTNELGPGGGGGGGIIHTIAPSTAGAGTSSVSPGSAGTPAVGTALNLTQCAGGSGGGACGGNGGAGGQVNTDDTATTAENGQPGIVVTTLRKPSKAL